MSAIPLFGKADSELEKCASGLLPDVVKYIDNLRPRKDAQYVLVNAMGAWEYYGSNINGDAFREQGLIHMPDDWTGNPLLDAAKGKKWSYGFPTFYGAHPYAHHKNKDATRAFGEVELATWNKNMRRVELVTRVDHEKCMKFGGTQVWDKLRIGDYPDVSMGTKVPYDTCSICLDAETYNTALATFDPAKHRHPGYAVLAYHNKLKAKSGKGIRGVSVTRKDYCSHCADDMNKIYPDGRKVFVHNDYPRFFDISFVYIGADRTAKVMLFIYRNGQVYSATPSAAVAETIGVPDPDEKAASVADDMLVAAFGKLAVPKRAELSKDVVPTQFAGKAVPLLTKNELDIPKSTLGKLSPLPIASLLSTLACLGMVLRPREFQRLVLTQLGKEPLADELEDHNCTFSKSEDSESMGLGSGHFMPALASLLLPLLASRSAFGPLVEKRVVFSTPKNKEKAAAPSHQSDLLDKIGAAYNGYRQELMELLPHSQSLLPTVASDELSKLASAQVEELFTPLSVAYFNGAYMDEFGVSAGEVVKQSKVLAWRGDAP